MPSVADLKQSKFLTKADVDPPVVATITGYEEVNVAKEGAPQEPKWVLHFKELEKPMVLNSTNGQLIAQITGSDDFDGWTGKRVELYNDPSISFGGKLTGGIRVRKAAGAAPATAGKAPQWTLEQAIAECGKAGIEKPKFIERLKNEGLSGWKPDRDTPLAIQMIEEASAEAAFAAIPSANEEMSF